MKYTILIALPAALLFSCGGETEKTADGEIRTDTVPDGTQVKEEVVEAQVSCYAWIKGKDTISLKISQTGNLVTGDLDYTWFEKDGNHGTIKGEMKGDTLVADYTFMAEGMESVRKEFMLKKGETFVIGDIDYEHDEEPYEAKDAKFNGELVLKKLDCK